jgi:hypothetical protein
MARMAPTPASPDACLNCGEGFGTPRPRYCPACGQETNLKPPTLREFAQQFGGSYIAVEGALWRTLGLLLFRPGEITREYLAGRRRRYVLPLRLYLTISLVVLLLVRTLAAVDIKFDDADLAAQRPQDLTIDLGWGRAGLKDGAFYCDSLPAWLCKRVQRRIDIDPKAIAREVTAFGERFVANLGGAMFLLVPAFALWLKLAYLNRRLRYTEHLVFALHVHAFWFLMLGLLLARLPWVSSTAALAIPLYTLLAMRRVYGGRWWPRLLRAGAISLLYGTTLGFALASVALWALLS